VAEVSTAPLAPEILIAPWLVGVTDGIGKSFGIVRATAAPFGDPEPPVMGVGSV